MVAEPVHLASIELDDPQANTREIVANLEGLDLALFWKDFLQQRAKARGVPLPVAQFIDEATDCLLGRDAEHDGEAAIDRGDPQLAVEDDQPILDRIHNVLGGDFLQIEAPQF